jgi:DNA-binding transcriptional ArsR family regulator
MNEELYAKHLCSFAVVENARMKQNMVGQEQGVWHRSKPLAPEKLLAAAKALYRKSSLTASDLAHILELPHPSAHALLIRLERAGLATSELHRDARIRIFTAKH